MTPKSPHPPPSSRRATGALSHVLVRLALAGSIACTTFVGCNSSPTPSSSPQPQSRATSTTGTAPPQGAPRQRLDTLEITTGGARPSDSLPLVIAIHGLGDRPEDFAGLYAGFPAAARIVLFRGPDRWGDGHSWFPFRAAASDDDRARGISSASERVAETIRSVAAERPTKGKPVITGFSQGGMLSFAVAVRFPDLVHAAVPIGGVLPEPLWPATSSRAPRPRIVALHGEADELVPVGPTRRGVETLRSRGWDARLETFPGVGHRIPPALRARYFELLALELASVQ